MMIRKLKAHVIASAILGVIVLGLAIALANQHIAANRASAELAEQKQALATLTQEAWSHRTVTGSFNKLTTILGGRYRVVSWSNQMPFMMNQLTGIMEAHKLKIDTLRPEPITSSGKVYRLPLRIGFKAALPDMARVVRDIEKTIPVMSIEQLAVRPVDKSDMLQADMVVSLFAIADPSAPMPGNLQSAKDTAAIVAVASPAVTPKPVTVTTAKATNKTKPAVGKLTRVLKLKGGLR